MCGILCQIHLSRSPIDAEKFQDALQLVAHRGPDGEGVDFVDSVDASIAMGHRRLSIFDLTDAGRQPMVGPNGLRIIYNGEVFNWPEIREELRAQGYSFRSNSDTEVILAAYDHWGPDCLKKFNGFWALLIYDPRTRSVFVSRDRFGIKPLYFMHDDHRWAFCSEIKPLWNALDLPPEVNAEQLSRYLVFGGSHDSEQTIYNRVDEIAPGTSGELNLQTGEWSKKQYWSLNDVEPIELNDKDALDRFEELIEDAVRLWLRSDRDVALTLSGGVDSSAIALATSRLGNKNIRAYTSHFPEYSEFDETVYAKYVASKLGLTHVLVVPDFAQLDAEDRSLSWHQELLYPGGSILVAWCVQKRIRADGIVVCLNGQGGDEVFLGYERYFAPFLIRQLLKPHRLLSSAFNVVRHSRLTFAELAGFLPYFTMPSIRDQRCRRRARRVLDPAFLSILSERAPTLPLDLQELQATEICGQQLRRLLRYDDRTASAHGLESRPALLDHRLVEFGFALGEAHKIRNGWTKYIIRRYLDRHGLADVAWRTNKFGYPAPTQKWASEFAKGADWSSLRGIVRKDIDSIGIPPQLLYPLHNLRSTAEQLNWSPLR